MNKAVMISIQPKWCDLIASGRKTIEVRKTVPKIDTPFKCYIYMTATKERCRFWEYSTAYQNSKGEMLDGSQKVIGEFVCDSISILPAIFITKNVYGASENAQRFASESCLTQQELIAYCGTNDFLYGLHISDLKIYDKPKELGEFKKYGYMTEEQWLYALYPNTHCHYQAWAKKFEITRPHKSWGYVEPLEV